MKAIVAGGAGFVGSHLAKRLLKEGWDVLVIDNLSSGHSHNIPKGAEFKELDLTDGERIKEFSTGSVDAVFHLASPVSLEITFEKPIENFETNDLSTMFLLQWCMKNNVKKFIYASSKNVYGKADSVYVDETDAICPSSPYSVAKVSSEKLCQTYQNKGMETTSLRLFDIYGPGQDLDNVYRGMVGIYMAFVARNEPIAVKWPQDHFRDFVFVGDAVDAFYRCLDSNASGKVYNVATGRKVFVWQLIDHVIETFGHVPEEYPKSFIAQTMQDQFELYGNACLIEKELGWKPMVSLEEGLIMMSPWVKELIEFDE